MAFDDLIWKIWELEKEARKKEREAEELRQRLEELEQLRISHEVRGGEIGDNVSFAGQPNSKDEFWKRLIGKLFELEKERIGKEERGDKKDGVDVIAASVEVMDELIKQHKYEQQGSFISVPSAFENVDKGLRDMIKLEFKTVFSEESSDPLKLETVFSTDKILVDIGAVKPSAINPEKIIKDCELVKQVALNHPQQLRQFIEKFQDYDIDSAYDIVNEIGLTEEASIKAGGGLIFTLLAVIAIAGAVSGCAKCRKYRKPDKPPK